MDAAVRYCFRLSVANPALPHPGCPGMAFNFWVVLEVEGCRFCLGATCFFQMKVKNFRRLSNKNIKMGQRWIKPVDPVDSDYSLTTGHRSHQKSSIFFLCGCCMLLCSGDWPLAQNLWRFESAALNTILDVAEVKAGECNSRFGMRIKEQILHPFNVYHLDIHLHQRNCASQWLHCSCHEMQWYSVHSLECAFWPVIVRPFFFGPSAEHWLSLS